MDVERLKQEYSLKTTDELTALLADSGSLADEARQLLAEELDRRNLDIQVAVENLGSVAVSSFAGRAWLLRGKWIGLWLTNTLNATLGVSVAVGSINYSIRPFAGRAASRQIMQAPYYPLPVVVAFLAGYFAFRRIRGSYCYWAWVLPAVSMIIAMAYWKASNRASWLEALGYFFSGHLPYPEASLQLATEGILLMSLTYSLAALVRGVARGTDSAARREK